MLAAEYDTMRGAEDAYWWYQVLREMTAREVTRLTVDHDGAQIMDAGCGTGGMLSRLKMENPSWQLRGVDLSAQAVAHTKERGIQNVREGNVARLPAGDDELDGIISLDVLYHENVNEPAAVREYLRALRPGGFLITNEPAFDRLFGSHDRAVKGVRRYTKGRMRSVLQDAGFSVTRQQYWNASFFLPMLAWRNLSRIMFPETGALDSKSDLTRLPSWVNTLLGATGRIDFRLCGALGIPFGTSVFTVGRKVAS